MSKYDITGKVAVITGSSRGIGKGIALALARAGASVVINGRNPDRLNDTEDEIKKVTSKVHSVICDVSKPEGGRQIVDETTRVFGRIDILINNVGVSMRGNFADLDPKVFQLMFESNTLSAVNPVQAALPHIRESKGSIIFISSVAGIRGLPGLSAYSSAKMALRAIAESIRIEESMHGIHVGLIYVSYTENEKDKVYIAGDGTQKLIAPRNGRGVQKIDSVARSVLKNIKRRRFITVLSPLGKLNAFLQPRFYLLVEKLIIRNLKKFSELQK